MGVDGGLSDAVFAVSDVQFECAVGFDGFETHLSFPREPPLEPLFSNPRIRTPHASKDDSFDSRTRACSAHTFESKQSPDSAAIIGRTGMDELSLDEAPIEISGHIRKYVRRQDLEDVPNTDRIGDHDMTLEEDDLLGAEVPVVNPSPDSRNLLFLSTIG